MGGQDTIIGGEDPHGNTAATSPRVPIRNAQQQTERLHPLLPHTQMRMVPPAESERDTWTPEVFV